MALLAAVCVRKQVVSLNKVVPKVFVGKETTETTRPTAVAQGKSRRTGLSTIRLDLTRRAVVVP